MASVKLLIVDEVTATELVARTAGSEDAISPRLVEAGEHAGMYAVSARASKDPAHTGVFSGLTFSAVTLDTDVAWPQPPE